jgi:phenylalanyl-tRNA synthetase beta chain
LLVDGATRVQQVAEFLRNLEPKLIGGVELFEVYRGPGVPQAKKSLNITVTLSSDKRTLSKEDEERFLQKLRSKLSEIGAELRG